MTEKTEPTEDFQTLIQEHQTKHKSTLAGAIQAVAKKHPEAHQAYLHAGGGPLEKIEADESKDFETLVDEYMDRNSCSRLKAMQAIVRIHPNKHREYLNAVNQRG